ncbi:MAG: transporter [Cytophagales bacterium]|nr:transporter [Cytophagales bacterium]
MRRFIFSVLGLCLCFSLLHAGGGWTLKKGRGFFKTESRFLSGNSFFGDDGLVVSGLGNTSFYIHSFYGEYGLSDRFNLIGNIPLVWNQYQPVNQNPENLRTQIFGLGDIQLGLKYGFFQDKKYVLSTSLYLGIPTGTNPDANLSYVQTGDQEFNQQIQVDGGLSLYPIPAYVSLGTYYNHRTQSYSEEIGGYVQAGYSLNRWMIKIFASANFSLRNGSRVNPVQRYSIYLNNSEYLAFGPEIGYRVGEKLALGVGVDLAAVSRNILATPSFSAYLHYEL